MAAHYNVPVIVVIVNNGYLSLIRQNQKYAYGFEYGTKLWYDDSGEKMTDFVKLAEALGCKENGSTGLRILLALCKGSCCKLSICDRHHRGEKLIVPWAAQ